MSLSTMIAAGVVIFLGSVLGDATIGATIAGLFTLVNTVLNTAILRRQRSLERGQAHTHKILTAPRRAIYDNQGKVIGTMLKLEDQDDWAAAVLPAQRAGDQEPEA